MPTINSLLPPYPTFRDAQGNPLNGGFIYIGQPGLEARTTPKASFFDEGLTIPTGTASGAAVRTSAGYPVGHNGSPANVYVDGDYSITVLNSAGVMVFSSLYPGFTFDTGATGGPILAPNGNLAATGFGFLDEQNTGFSRPDSGQIQTVANGVLVSTATETGTVFSQPLSGAGFLNSVGWKPYNGTNGLLYDVAVSGATAGVEATFEDGYEYLLIGDNFSGDGASSSPALRVYRAQAAAYTLVVDIFSGTDLGAGSYWYAELFFADPRVTKRAHLAYLSIAGQSGAVLGDSILLITSTGSRVGITHAVATKIDKAEISMTSGNIDAGKFLLFRRQGPTL